MPASARRIALIQLIWIVIHQASCTVLLCWLPGKGITRYTRAISAKHKITTSKIGRNFLNVAEIFFPCEEGWDEPCADMEAAACFTIVLTGTGSLKIGRRR